MNEKEYGEMNMADALCNSFVKFVKNKYETFSPLSKSISEGKWEEWVRNHIEATIHIVRNSENQN